MAYWYVAQNNELMIDLDDYMRPSKSGEAWGETFFRRRLRDAILADKLYVEAVYLSQSASKRHYHAIILLKHPISTIERLVWQLHLGSDLYRGRADLMRHARGIPYPSLLILPNRFPDFYRPPDAICECTRKHDTQEQFQLGENACRVWRIYRGMSPWELFGQSSQDQERGVALPLGRIPLRLILWFNWDV